MSTIRFRNGRTGEIVTRLSEPIGELTSRAKRERGHDAVLSGPAEVRFTWDEIAEDDGDVKRGQDGATDMAQLEEDDLWDEERAEGQENNTERDDRRDRALLLTGQGPSKGDAETTRLHSIMSVVGIISAITTKSVLASAPVDDFAIKLVRAKQFSGPTTRIIGPNNRRKLGGLLAVLRICQKALLDKTVTSRRAIFESSKPLFGKQSVVNNLVDDLSATFGITPLELMGQSKAVHSRRPHSTTTRPPV